MKTTPLVSCVCVTNKKPSHLEKSIRYFLAQTYLNTEMVIIHQSKDLNYFHWIPESDGENGVVVN
jgi:hypothetical protein